MVRKEMIEGRNYVINKGLNERIIEGMNQLILTFIFILSFRISFQSFKI